MSEPRGLGSTALVRLVAAREISARVRDKNFIISSIVILVLLLGTLGLQVALSAGGEQTRVGVVGDVSALGPALEAQGQALDVDVAVVELDDEAAARTAIGDGDVDGVLVAEGSGVPRLLVEQSASGPLQAVVQGAVVQRALAEQLAQAGVTSLEVPEVAVTALDPEADANGQRVVVAIIGVGGALAFDLVDIPRELVGTALSVVLWFVLGYAFYAAIFAVAASLVSRQEDLGTVIMPTTLVLVVAFIVGIQASAEPDGALAVITSYVPGLSPLVMPVRQAAGDVALWEIGLAVVLMLVAVAVILRLGGRVYAGALLRTSGKTKLREALKADRA